MSDRELLELAAETETARRTSEYWKAEHVSANTEIDALKTERAALAAEPAQPVAWMLTEKKKYGDSVVLRRTRPDNTDPTWWDITPLFAAPQLPADVPLTADEISDLVDLYAYKWEDGVDDWATQIVRVVERAHGIV